jgi:hypothetical protein
LEPGMEYVPIAGSLSSLLLGVATNIERSDIPIGIMIVKNTIAP